MITVDRSKCVACGSCTRVCPVFIPSLKDGALHLREGAPCLSCMQCVSVCPVHALHAEGVPEELERIPLRPREAGDPEVVKGIVQARRSMRAFSEKPVERELLQAGIDLTQWCASAKNNHLHRWSVLYGREAIAPVAALCREHSKKTGLAPEVWKQAERGTDLVGRGAAAAVLVSAPEDYYFATVDPVIALSTAELYWQACGLGTMWSGMFMRFTAANAEIRAACGIEEGYRCCGAMLVGHPAMPPYRSVVYRPAAAIHWM